MFTLAPQCTTRSLELKLKTWPGLLPNLLKAVRLTLAAVGGALDVETRYALMQLKNTLQKHAEAMVEELMLEQQHHERRRVRSGEDCAMDPGGGRRCTGPAAHEHVRSIVHMHVHTGDSSVP